MTTHAATSSDTEQTNRWGRPTSRRRKPRVKTPMWRRFTSLISLGSIVIIVGVSIAALLGIAALLMLVLLESAAR